MGETNPDNLKPSVEICRSSPNNHAINGIMELLKEIKTLLAEIRGRVETVSFIHLLSTPLHAARGRRGRVGRVSFSLGLAAAADVQRGNATELWQPSFQSNEILMQSC